MNDFNHTWVAHWAEAVRGEILARLLLNRIKPEEASTNLYDGDLLDVLNLYVGGRPRQLGTYKILMSGNGIYPEKIYYGPSGENIVDRCWPVVGRNVPQAHLHVPEAWQHAIYQTLTEWLWSLKSHHNKLVSEYMREIGGRYMLSQHEPRVTNIYLKSEPDVS